MEEVQDQQLDQAEAVQVEQRGRNKYSLFIVSGVVVAVTLAFITIAYFYLNKDKNSTALGPTPTPVVSPMEDENEASGSSEVVISSDEDLENILDEIDSTDETESEKDYQQALSESSGL